MASMSDCEKERLMQEAYRRGFELEQKYYGCAQCVIGALQDFFYIDDAVFKAATSLSGGFASSIEGPCGAFTGGILVLSYFFGRAKEQYADIGLLRRPAPLVMALWEKFKEKYGGGYTCREIQNFMFGRAYHFLDGNEYRAYEEEGGHRDKCPAVVGRACAWVAGLLIDHNIPLRRF